MAVRPAKTQISLGIGPVWPESSLCAQLVAKDPTLLHADNEDYDQTWQMIWVFIGHTLFCWFCHAVAQMANSLDPDQTAAPLGAVCPGSTLFA